MAEVAAAGVLPIVLGGDHTIALPDVTGVARHVGWGRVAVIHFDAHADTGETQLGSLYGHGTPMRRLIESGACRGDRFIQIGLRGYWPEPETLDWMAAAGHALLRDERDRARAASTPCSTRRWPSRPRTATRSSSRWTSTWSTPGSAPGTGTPEPGGLTSRQLLDAVRRIAMDRSARWAWTSWRSRPPTTTPRSRPTSATGSSSRPSAAWPGARKPRARRGRAQPQRPAAQRDALVAHRVEDLARPVSSVVLGCRNARRATVSPSHLVGVTKATWSRRSWWLHCV